MEEKLVINRKKLKGEDGYRVFSIRVRKETVCNLDRISQASNRSRNDIINLLLDYAIKNCEVKYEKK